MRKFLSLFSVLIFIFYFSPLVGNAFIPDREIIYERFINAVSKEDSPLQHKSVERAFWYLIVKQSPEKAKKLLAKAGWFGGFSLNLYVPQYQGDKIEIEWLITELEKIGVYLMVRDY